MISIAISADTTGEAIEALRSLCQPSIGVNTKELARATHSAIGAVFFPQEPVLGTSKA